MKLTELIMNWLTERGYGDYICRTRTQDCYYVAPMRGPRPTIGRFIRFVDDTVYLYRNLPPNSIDYLSFWAGDANLFKQLEEYFPSRI